MIPTFPKKFPARPGLRGGKAAAAALGAGRLGLRAAAGSGRRGPRRTAGGGEPWRSASLQIQKKGGDGGYSGDTLDVFICFRKIMTNPMIGIIRHFIVMNF